MISRDLSRFVTQAVPKSCYFMKRKQPIKSSFSFKFLRFTSVSQVRKLPVFSEFYDFIFIFCDVKSHCHFSVAFCDANNPESYYFS